MGFLADKEKLQVSHAPGIPETFSRYYELVFPTYIAAHAWPLYNKKSMDILLDSGHVHIMMHVGIAK